MSKFKKNVVPATTRNGVKRDENCKGYKEDKVDKEFDNGCYGSCINCEKGLELVKKNKK